MNACRGLIYHGSPVLWEPEPGFEYGRPRIDKAGLATGQKRLLSGMAWYATSCADNARNYGKKTRPISQLSGVVESFGFSRKFSDSAAAAFQGGMDPDQFVAISIDPNAKHSMAGCGIDDASRMHFIHDVWRKMNGHLHLYSVELSEVDASMLLNADIEIDAQSSLVASRLMDAAGRLGVQPISGDMNAGDVLKLIERVASKAVAWEAVLVESGIPGVARTDKMAEFRGLCAQSYAFWDQGLLDRMTVRGVEITPSGHWHGSAGADPSVAAGGIDRRIANISGLIGDQPVGSGAIRIGL